MATFLHPDSQAHRLLTEFARFFVPRPVHPTLAGLAGASPAASARPWRWALWDLQRRGLLSLQGVGSDRAAFATPHGRKLLALARLPRLEPRPASRRDLLVTYDIPRTLNSARAKTALRR